MPSLNTIKMLFLFNFPLASVSAPRHWADLLCTDSISFNIYLSYLLAIFPLSLSIEPITSLGICLSMNILGKIAKN